MVAEEPFLPPIGWVRPKGQPLPDDEVRRVVVEMCERGGQHQPPPDLREETLLRLRNGEPAREVADWLCSQLRARSEGAAGWVGALLDDS